MKIIKYIVTGKCEADLLGPYLFDTKREAQIFIDAALAEAVIDAAPNDVGNANIAEALEYGRTHEMIVGNCFTAKANWVLLYQISEEVIEVDIPSSATSKPTFGCSYCDDNNEQCAVDTIRWENPNTKQAVQQQVYQSRQDGKGYTHLTLFGVMDAEEPINLETPISYCPYCGRAFNAGEKQQSEPDKLTDEDDVASHNNQKSDNGFDLTNFILYGNNREEAFQAHLEYEEGFSPDCQSIMDFETFCKELDLGYGESGCIQIARLYEAADGKIWYDTEYYG